MNNGQHIILNMSFSRVLHMENTWVALVKSFPKKVFSFYSNDYELKVKILPSSHEQTQKAANFSWLVKRYDCVCVCARAIRGERQSKEGSL